MHATRRAQTGPGWGRQRRRWEAALRTGRLPRAVGELIVSVVRARAFGAGGQGSDGRRHPKGVDLVETGRLRSGWRVLRVRGKTAILGVSGPAAAYADAVQARRPWMATTKRDRRVIREQLTATIRLAVRVAP